jgi:hypothetical protein
LEVGQPNGLYVGVGRDDWACSHQAHPYQQSHVLVGVGGVWMARLPVYLACPQVDLAYLGVVWADVVYRALFTS